MNLVAPSTVDRFEEVADDQLQGEMEDQLRSLRAAGVQNEVASEVRNRIDQSKRKDAMLTILLNAFLPVDDFPGVLYETTNWAYRGISLEISGSPVSADFTIFDLDDHGVGFITCLTEPGAIIENLETLEQLAISAGENISDIEEQITDTGRRRVNTDNIFTVLSVPHDDFEYISEEFEEATIQETQAGSWIWELSITEEHTISIYSDLTPESDGGMSMSGDLDNALSQSTLVERESQASPDLFPTSHRHSKAEHLVENLVKKRVPEDVPNTHFTMREAVEYFEDQRNFAKTSGIVLGRSDAVEIVDWWQEVDIVSSISPSQTDLSGANRYYRFSINAQKPSGIMRTVSDETEDNIIREEFERYAMRETLDNAGHL